MNKKYKAAAIGCSNIGAREWNYGKQINPSTHAEAFRQNKKVELVALVDKSKEILKKAKSYYPKVSTYINIDKMFQEIRPDVVSIASPTSCHYNHVLQLAKHKCPVIICEKPISYDIKEAQKMISMCKQSGTQLFINHQRHFDPLYQKWGRKVRNGLLGEIYQGSIYYYNGLFNSVTHFIDLLRLFLGDPVSVKAEYNKRTSSLPDDLNIDGVLKFCNGTLVNIQSLSKNYGHYSIRLFGERGMIELTNLLYEVQYRKKVRNKNFKNFFELSNNIIREGSARSLMVSVINHVVNYLEGKTDPTSTGEDGLAVLKILIALEKSAKSGGKEVKL